MRRALAEMALAVRAAVDDRRVAPADGERLIGRLLLDAVGDGADHGARRELIAFGVDPSLVEAAVDEVRGARLETEAATVLAGAELGDEVERILVRLEAFGDPAEWEAATTYDSVALAIIDSVWSIGVRYTGVLNVLDRYRSLRRDQGGDVETDRPADLVACIGLLGGAEAFAVAVKNRQRTSARSGILKADAVHRQATMLASEGIESPRDLAEAAPARLEQLRYRWTQEVPGQASGLSWDYLLMLLGMQGVKADRMIRRFVADALASTEEQVSAARAHTLVTAAAEQLNVGASHLDYAIWRFQSGQ